jgi:predicted lactoylglutathione lyase
MRALSIVDRPVRLHNRSMQRTFNTERRKQMSTKIFVNLPVADLQRSVKFFTALGYAFNPQFTDETATCMIVSDDIFVMLLTEEKFRSFTPKALCDAKRNTEVLVALSCESREAVDAMVRKAVAAGGSTYSAAQDHGFMYQHGYQDPDGHIWELVWMDPAALASNAA